MTFARGTSLALFLLDLLACRICAADEPMQAKINAAIDSGVAYLRMLPDQSGMWQQQTQPAGMTALAAWTLLESGVSAKDPLVRKAADYLRQASVGVSKTYSLSLAILFFDRLADPWDQPLIQSLAVRLLAGQDSAGSWTYDCPAAEQGEQERLRKYLDQVARLRATGKLEGKPGDLLQVRMTATGKLQRPGSGDTSNTQFAMMALWVARRHAVPVDSALLRVGVHFRKYQFPNGGWAYHHYGLEPARPGGIAPRGSLTCAGLLGLALEHGLAKKHKILSPDPKKDPQVQAGLRLLGTVLTNPDGPKEKQLLGDKGIFVYFLFSLERMAVVYDLKTIGGTDWYRWGAQRLLASQQAAGNWPGDHGAADTCFALLFLKRANVAEDLTLDLKGIVRDKNSLREKAPNKKAPVDLPLLVPKEKEKKTPPPKSKQSRLDNNPLDRVLGWPQKRVCLASCNATGPANGGGRRF